MNVGKFDNETKISNMWIKSLQSSLHSDAHSLDSDLAEDNEVLVLEKREEDEVILDLELENRDNEDMTELEESLENIALEEKGAGKFHCTNAFVTETASIITTLSTIRLLGSYCHNTYFPFSRIYI